MRSFRFAFVFALSIFLAAAVQAGPRKSVKVPPAKAECAEVLTSEKDSSVPQGILKHGEHWIDLILAQAGQLDPRAGRAFVELGQRLLKEIAAGELPVVNEKIDGSPSVVIGFTSAGTPFITYKNDLTAKRQRLVQSADDARGFGPKLQPMYAQAIGEIGPALKNWAQNVGKQIANVSGVDLHELVFQGDLLFADAATDEARLVRDAQEVKIQANSLAYRISASHPLFAQLGAAHVGLAFHTVGKRVIQEGGRIGVEVWNVPALLKRQVVENLVAALNTPSLFVVGPWRHHVRLSRGLDQNAVALARALLGEIETRLAQLTSEFKKAWASQHESRFRIFFNSYLKPPSTGGFFRDAKEGKPLDIDRVLRRFNGWLAERIKREVEPMSYENAYRALVSGPHAPELRAVIAAYYAAAMLQYVLQPALGEMFVSQLGGGEVEGVMLESSDTIVKFVDRLGFTLKNNQHWNRGAIYEPDAFGSDEVRGDTPLPAPFFGLQGGEAFLLMKGQPVHSGHIEMIRQAAQLNGQGVVHVILSSKEPRLDAEHWRELKVADTRKELERGAYMYVFDTELKRALLEAGLKKEIRAGHVQIHTLNPGLLWIATGRLLRDRELGVGLARTIRLVMGEKEMEQARYDDQLELYNGVLEPLVVPMQSGGVSATLVRRALRDTLSDQPRVREAAIAVILDALKSIPNSRTRGQMMRKIVARYALVHGRVQELLGEK